MKKIIFLLAIVILGCSKVRQQKEPITLQAINDFEQIEQKPYVKFYAHKQKKALAVNAGKFKDQFAIAKSSQVVPKGKYQVTLITLGETDGESSYRIFIDDQLVAEKQNQPTAVDYQIQNLDFGTINIKKAAKIKVAFSSHTNGNIPEGNGTAYSRGRWKTLILSPIH